MAELLGETSSDPRDSAGFGRRFIAMTREPETVTVEWERTPFSGFASCGRFRWYERSGRKDFDNDQLCLAFQEN